MEVELLALTAEDVSKKLRLAEFWTLFTQDELPWQKKSALCRHCLENYNHHKKSEYAKLHLNSCSAFRKYMHGMEVEERPEWYTGVRRRFSPQKGRQTSLMSYTIPSTTPDEEYKFRRLLSMHFYVTGTSFQRVEDPHLIAACKVTFCSL
jgi:hypothetical protein